MFTLQLSSPSVWFLHVHLGLSSASLSRVSILPLILVPPSTLTTNTTTLATPTMTTPPLNQDLGASLPAYAAIGVLISFVLVLLLCVGVAVSVACMAKGKARFQEKASTIREKGLCEELNSKRGLKNSYQCFPKMKRTRSTIGFPTREGQLKATGEEKNSVVSPPIPPSYPLHKSQSLPSVLPPHVIGKSIAPLPFSREQHTSTRRTTPRVHTRVKKLNVDVAEQSWTAAQFKGHKELSHLQVVQDLVLKHNKYGVNEITGPPTQTNGLYARYVVRSLAASAKTPEPGSTPITRL